MSNTMKEVQRTQTIIGTLVNVSEISLLQTVGKAQKGVLNLTYNSFSGINRYQDVLERGSNYLRTVILGLENVNKKIDDEYKRVCVEKAVGNIKSNWTNCLKKIRSIIKQNKNLSELDRRYLYTVIKVPEIFQKIITRKGKVDYQNNKYLGQFYGEVEVKRLNNLLRRYVRKYKSKAYTKKDRNIYLNKNLYSLDKKKDMRALRITTTSQNKGKRSEIKLSTYFNKTKRMIQISIQKDNSLKIHVPYIKQVHKYFKKEQELGLDVGMRDILALSNGNSYGMNSTEIFYAYSDAITDKNRNRNRLYAYYRKCLEEGKIKKAENILKNNLVGSIKRDRHLNKKKSHCKSMINHAIREMIKNENLAHIIKEDLSWKSDKKNLFSKKQRNRFTTWLKGYIIERLESYFEMYEITYEDVNPAYTSQICHKCKKLGKRTGEWFYCEEHGKIPSDINAAINIKDRKLEKDITLNMSPKQVKAFYLNN